MEKKEIENVLDEMNITVELTKVPYSLSRKAKELGRRFWL